MAEDGVPEAIPPPTIDPTKHPDATNDTADGSQARVT